MLNIINEILKRCVKRLFNSIKDDCINNIIGCGMALLVALISITISIFVNNNKIAFGIIALIVIVSFFLTVFYYKGKE